MIARKSAPGEGVHGLSFELLRTGVAARAEGCAIRRLRECLRDAEVDDFELSAAGNEHVGRFEVAVDNSILMRVPHGIAELQKEREPCAWGELLLLTPARERLRALHELHDDVGMRVGGASGIEHARDVRMIHARERFQLLLKAAEHVRAVHAGLQQLQRDLTRQRLVLPRMPDTCEAAFTEKAEQLVGTDALRCHESASFPRSCAACWRARRAFSMSPAFSAAAAAASSNFRRIAGGTSISSFKSGPNSGRTAA